LYLLDYGVGNQYFDPRNEGAILKSRYCDAVHISQIIWLYWTNVIAKATTQGEAEKGGK
jgi:hypothetical protein